MNELLKNLCMKNGLSGDETDVREYIKEIISSFFEMNRQSRFNAWYRMLGAGALG